MHLKKTLALICTGLVTAAIFTGCGEDSKPAQQENDQIMLGLIRNLNSTEAMVDNTVKKIFEKANIEYLLVHNATFYNSLQSMQMALESGVIDEISLYKCVADYLVARNPSFEILNNHNPLKFSDNFCFAMRTEDTALKNSVDSAIEEMRNDGTLETLTKTYITDLKDTEEPPAVAFENFESADTIKVGVTGDLPPFDLVLANGEIAGFNTAILSELGKRLQKNIEIVQIDSASRAAALSSGQIDVVFWAIIPTNEDMPADADKPQGVELSAPYFTDEIVHVTYKK